MTSRRFTMIAPPPLSRRRPVFACGVLAVFAGMWGCSGTGQSQRSDTALGATTSSEEVRAGDSASPVSAIKTSDAVRTRPEHNVTRSSWKFGDATGTLITTPNYQLYTTVDSATFLERLPVFYELALEHYTTALGDLPKPDRKLDTFLFLTRRQWQTKTQEMLPDQAEMFAGLGRGGFTTRGTSVLYYIDRYGYPRDTFAIAAHEGWHQYTQLTFKHQLPIWLEEGISTYMEGYRREPNNDDLPVFDPKNNDERRYTLREALWREDLIPLDQLLSRPPQQFLTASKDQLLTYYAQVWALTRYLAEGEDGRYREALQQVVRDAAEGNYVGRMAASPYAGSRRRGVSQARIGPAVVQEYFNADLAEFEAGYLAFAQQLAQQRFESRRRR